MKQKLLPIALLLLLLLSVVFSACILEDPNEEGNSETQGESDLGTGSQTETDATGDETNDTESGDSDTETESTDDAGDESNNLDDLYPNEPDDGYSKRY